MDKKVGVQQERKAMWFANKSSGTVAASQEQAPNTPCRSVHNASSTPGHSKKSKKCGKLKKLN